MSQPKTVWGESKSYRYYGNVNKWMIDSGNIPLTWNPYDYQLVQPEAVAEVPAVENTEVEKKDTEELIDENKQEVGSDGSGTESNAATIKDKIQTVKKLLDEINELV